MYAIIRDGGRQHKVEAGKTIAIDRPDLKPGETLEFNEVLLFRDDENITIGTPTVANAKVVGEVKGSASGPKVYAVQYRRRKNSRRKVGHRQKYSEVLIKDIVGPK